MLYKILTGKYCSLNYKFHIMKFYFKVLTKKERKSIKTFNQLFQRWSIWQYYLWETAPEIKE